MKKSKFEKAAQDPEVTRAELFTAWTEDQRNGQEILIDSARETEKHVRVMSRVMKDCAKAMTEYLNRASALTRAEETIKIRTDNIINLAEQSAKEIVTKAKLAANTMCLETEVERVRVRTLLQNYIKIFPELADEIERAKYGAMPKRPAEGIDPTILEAGALARSNQ